LHYRILLYFSLLLRTLQITAIHLLSFLAFPPPPFRRSRNGGLAKFLLIIKNTLTKASGAKGKEK